MNSACINSYIKVYTYSHSNNVRIRVCVRERGDVIVTVYRWVVCNSRTNNHNYVIYN